MELYVRYRNMIVGHDTRITTKNLEIESIIDCTVLSMKFLPDAFAEQSYNK